MRDTRLILIEGLPGSGKSTLAQFLARALTQHGICHKWWYEEELGHPVYLFDDAATLQQVLDDMSAGRYPKVIAAALDRWRAFAAGVASGDQIIVLDSCLFGYLTWTLFPFAAPLDVIHAYLAEVRRIIAVLNPTLIYLYQDDVARALRVICDRRGGETEQRLIRNATESPYGQRHGLRGFAGMIALWRDYRRLTDMAVAATRMPTLAVENSAGDWPRYQQLVVDFLDLRPARDLIMTPAQLEPFVGVYHGVDVDGAVACRVWVEGDHLMVDGLPQVWPHTPLIPADNHVFAITSLPFTVEFVAGANGTVERLIASGPPLLFGRIDCTLERVSADGDNGDGGA